MQHAEGGTGGFSLLIALAIRPYMSFETDVVPAGTTEALSTNKTVGRENCQQ